MHFQTFSVVVGSRACNASCPFCISKQTGLLTFAAAEGINWRNFDIACKLAKRAGTTTVLLTGKGEPTLYPSLIETYLGKLQKQQFPLIELQTNGIALFDERFASESTLKRWLELGLTTIALSVVHWNSVFNRRIYNPTSHTYYDLGSLINKLHNIGFSVRLCVMLLKGYIDTPSQVDQMISFARCHKVEQLTFRNIVASKLTEHNDISRWTKEHALNMDEIDAINKYVNLAGTLLHRLMHDTVIYDVDGQNVCLGTCLTQDPNQNEFRQLIFFPDGSLYWDWQYKGARIL